MFLKLKQKIIALISVGVFIVPIITGCSPDNKAVSNIPVQQETKATESITADELLNFSLGYENTYCDILQTNKNFYDDMNSTEFNYLVGSDGNDVPKMRMIGNKYKTTIESLDITARVDDLNKSKFKEKFSDSLRNLSIADEHLNKWVNGNAGLSSVDEFKNVVLPELQSINVAAGFIPDAYKREFGSLIYEKPELNTKMTSGWADVEPICQATIQLMAAKKPKETYIKLTNGDSPVTRGTDNSFKIYGETSANCSKVVADAYDETGTLYNEYQLTKYKQGDTTFAYGIREDWDNLKPGQNTYKFTAYCDNDQKKEISTTLTLNSPTPVNSGLSNDNYYTNSAGTSVHSPAYSNTIPTGATAKCADGTYSFSQSRRGTCSHHGGVAEWL